MNTSALVRSPLKTSGSSPIGFMSGVRGMGRRLAGKFGPAGIGSPPAGGPPGGPPPPHLLPPSPPPGGPPPLPWGFHSIDWELSPSSVHLNALSKLIASLVSTSKLVWVTMVGGSYLWEYRAIQAGVG